MYSLSVTIIFYYCIVSNVGNLCRPDWDIMRPIFIEKVKVMVLITQLVNAMRSHNIDELYCMHLHFYAVINIGLMMSQSVRTKLPTFETIQ